MRQRCIQCEASDKVTDFSVLSDPLAPKMFPLKNFDVGDFFQKLCLIYAKLLLILSYQCLYNNR